MKRLLLCRHAKSGWSDSTMADIDRPLNTTGKKEAAKMGQRLASYGIRPDLIISSPARRALSTAVKLAKGVIYPQQNIVVNDKIYAARPDELLHVIRRLDNSLNTVYLIGHNPEITLLANFLGTMIVNNVPTCGIVALEFNVRTWDESDRSNCSLIFFDYPARDGGEKVH